MALGRQAKVLSATQLAQLLKFVGRTRYPLRNYVIVLLSFMAGLRAKEIAALEWRMLTTPDGEIGNDLLLEDRASKGRSGRSVPICFELRQALIELKSQPQSSSCYVVTTERQSHTSPEVIGNVFRQWYRACGLNGCSSHSGRRTFITLAARNIGRAGGSLRDVQSLAGHSNLQTTQRYIDVSEEAKRLVIDLSFGDHRHDLSLG